MRFVSWGRDRLRGLNAEYRERPRELGATMIKFVTVVAMAALAGIVAIPVSADHKGPCHGQGCDGGGDLDELS